MMNNDNYFACGVHSVKISGQLNVGLLLTIGSINRKEKHKVKIP